MDPSEHTETTDTIVNSSRQESVHFENETIPSALVQPDSSIRRSMQSINQLSPTPERFMSSSLNAVDADTSIINNQNSEGSLPSTNSQLSERVSRLRNWNASNLLTIDESSLQRRQSNIGDNSVDESLIEDIQPNARQEDQIDRRHFLFTIGGDTDSSNGSLTLPDDSFSVQYLQQSTQQSIPRSQNFPGIMSNANNGVTNNTRDSITTESTQRETNAETDSDWLQRLMRPLRHDLGFVGTTPPPNNAQYNAGNDADINGSDSELDIPILRSMVREYLREHPEEDTGPPTLESLMSHEPLDVLRRRRHILLEPFGIDLRAGEHLFNFFDHGFSGRQVNSEKLPTKVFSTETVSTQLMCHICLEHYNTGDELKTLPCFHDFHPVCIDKWLETYPTCPVCRTTVCTDEDGQ
ncbi:uncharacterized protein LOC127842311 isoform X2 [Dreissena polymorpha]|uniref:RING-type domain-containing protein n=2 Tax=Dreissena polymorpha TaxID=45954 RepID=A0A9D4IU45_DREPO|nr:uncharacterized protein LOC127842311 isoform X2 [Dreissena polymorpha]KAH3785014.1 hypothetical protein DPMN_163097 [Dreissena polymorpha]